jgi:hypothetical protein
MASDVQRNVPSANPDDHPGPTCPAKNDPRADGAIEFSFSPAEEFSLGDGAAKL